ncbi:hypothetical protein K8T06_01500 [bacterium]|nr:hypothetical protein [bacterium]
MKKIFSDLCKLCLIIFVFSIFSKAATVHVPGDYPTIQEAHDNAIDGDTILVAPGTYEEHLTIGNRVTLLSEEGPENTLIHGTIDIFYIAFRIGGFSISGYKEGLGGIIQFDAFNNGLIIRDCIIYVDEEEVPAGTSWRCIGAREAAPFEVKNCLIMNSSSCTYGAGIYGDSCGINFQNNIFFNNHAELHGGAIFLYSCSPHFHTGIKNNVFFNNSAPQGGAISLQSYQMEIRNNVFVKNNSQSEDGAISNLFSLVESPIIEYNDFWQNIGGDYHNCEIGTGNIYLDPMFVGLIDLDFHLNDCSPCIDSGHPEDEYSEEPSPNGGRINVGVYGNTTEAMAWSQSCSTRTPTPTSVPTATPTATPYVCITTGVYVEMPSSIYSFGDICWCNAHVCNDGSIPLIGYPLFVILDVWGEYFFGPDFTEEPDSYLVFYPSFNSGETIVEVLAPFAWPENTGTVEGVRFIGALTNPDVTEIMGDFSIFEFGWGN